MTDDEIDAAILAALNLPVTKEFPIRAYERNLFRVGYRVGIEVAVKACIVAVPRAHTYASENADSYIAANNARDRCVAAIRDLAD